MKKIVPVIAMAAIGLSSSANASSVSGRVTSLTVRASDGLHIVEVQGPRDARPACARYAYFMIRDEKGDVGKEQFAMLMAAWLSGKPVIVGGAGGGKDIKH